MSLHTRPKLKLFFDTFMINLHWLCMVGWKQFEVLESFSDFNSIQSAAKGVKIPQSMQLCLEEVAKMFILLLSLSSMLSYGFTQCTEVYWSNGDWWDISDCTRPLRRSCRKDQNFPPLTKEYSLCASSPLCAMATLCCQVTSRGHRKQQTLWSVWIIGQWNTQDHLLLPCVLM